MPMGYLSRAPCAPALRPSSGVRRLSGRGLAVRSDQRDIYTAARNDGGAGADQVEWKLTISVSPTLAAMLADPLLQYR